MRTSRTPGAPVAFLLLLLAAGGGVGCRKDCNIAPGTSAEFLPLLSGVPSSYCSPDEAWGLTEEEKAFFCCSYRGLVGDAGVASCYGGSFDCANVAPADFHWLGDPYGGWKCDPSGSSSSDWICGVWIRDGRVVGACEACFPD